MGLQDHPEEGDEEAARGQASISARFAIDVVTSETLLSNFQAETTTFEPRPRTAKLCQEIAYSCPERGSEKQSHGSTTHCGSNISWRL